MVTLSFTVRDGLVPLHHREKPVGKWSWDTILRHSNDRSSRGSPSSSLAGAPSYSGAATTWLVDALVAETVRASQRTIALATQYRGVGRPDHPRHVPPFRGLVRPDDQARLRKDWEDFVDAASLARKGKSTGSLTFRMPSFTDGGTRYGGDVTFGSVQEYEASSCWRLVRSTWHSRHQDARCFVCGRTDEIELHHLSYEALGYGPDWEIVDQLVPLCTSHHHEPRSGSRPEHDGQPRMSL